jgi:HAD superfamily hydrolase (TIGR01490 family)
MNLVFFDFDDTVTALDTTLPLGAHLAGRRHARLRIFLLVLALALGKVRRLSNTGLKRVFGKLFLRGQTIEDIRQLALQFHRTSLNTLIDDKVMGVLRMHVDRGDHVYLVSASFDCLLEPLVEHWSLAGVIATEAEHHAGIYSGEIVGPACHGREKLRRTVTRFGEAAVRGATAYGNRDDAPLLGAVRTGYLVRRVTTPGLLERLRRWGRIFAGKLTREDLAAARIVEPFPAANEPGTAGPAKA